MLNPYRFNKEKQEIIMFTGNGTRGYSLENLLNNSQASAKFPLDLSVIAQEQRDIHN